MSEIKSSVVSRSSKWRRDINKKKTKQVFRGGAKGEIGQFSGAGQTQQVTYEYGEKEIRLI